MIEQILKEAKNRVDEAEVLLASGESISAEMKRKEIAIGTLSESSGLIIRIIKDGKIGVSCTDNPDSWRPCLDAAIHSSQFSDRIDWKGLPEPADLDKKPLTFDENVRTDPALLQDLINRLMAGSETYPDAQITSGSVSLYHATHTLANTSGIWYESRDSGVHLGLETIADQSTGYESDSSWELARINPEKIGETAAFFASNGRDGEELKTGSYNVVLSPIAFGHLLDAVVLPAFSGRNVHTGRSYFADKMGAEVMDTHISLVDDPFDKRGNGCTAWDGEGTPTRKVNFVKDGVLSSFAYDLRTAYRYGEESTGSATRTGQNGAPGIGFHNLIFDARRENVMSDDSVYIHDLIGAHTANPMSGDFSVELSSPYFIKGGSLERPIKTGMLSGNVFEMLKNVSGASHEVRTIGSLIVPSVRVSNLSLIGRA